MKTWWVLLGFAQILESEVCYFVVKVELGRMQAGLRRNCGVSELGGRVYGGKDEEKKEEVECK